MSAFRMNSGTLGAANHPKTITDWTTGVERVLLLAAVGATLLASPPAFAQTASENFSYRAPSGMFGEGTTIWNNYRFIHEDRERMLNGILDGTTGSIQGGAQSSGTAKRTGKRERR